MSRKIKLILDVIMLLASLTLFSKHFIGMNYHEIAGIVLVVLSLIHIFLNVKTIKGMCRNYVRIPKNVQLCLIIDIMLVICYAFIGISGVMISKTILTSVSSGSMIFRLGHTFVSALSVILLGIHIGLHMCRKPMKPVLAALFTVLVLAGGIWGVTSSSEVRWLTSPFSVGNQMGSGKGYGRAMEHPDDDSNEGLADHSDGDSNEGLADHSDGDSNDGLADHSDGDSNDGLADHSDGSREFQAKGNGYGKNQDSKGEGMHMQGPMGGGMSSSPLQKLSTLAQFGGMILSFAMAAYWIVVLRKKKAR